MYTIYHIDGVKWGCTGRYLEKRLKEQGYSIEDCANVITVGNIDKASQMEIDLNIQYGYRGDFDSYKVVLEKQVKSRAPNVRAKAKKTCIDKFGSPMGMCHKPEARAKNEKILIEKYGNVAGVLISPEIQKKASEAKIKKYGSIVGHLNKPEIREKASISRQKAVLQFNINGEFIKEFESNKKAAKELNISRGIISSCCTGNLKTAGGFIWKYKNI